MILKRKFGSVIFWPCCSYALVVNVAAISLKCLRLMSEKSIIFLIIFLHYLAANVYSCIFLTGSRKYMDVALPCTVRRACSSTLPRGFLAIQMYMPVSFSCEATILKDDTQQTEVRQPNETRAIGTMRTTVIIHISVHQNES